MRRSRILPRRNPLCESDGFSPEICEPPRTQWKQAKSKCTPIKRVSLVKLGNQRTWENYPDRQGKKIPVPTLFYGTPSCLGAIPRTAVPLVTYRRYVSVGGSHSFRNVPPARANPAVFALTPNPKNAKAVLLEETASHFLGIGVPLGYRISVSRRFQLKYRTSSD